MLQVYEPVMLLELLERGGTTTEEEVARALLAEDRSQVEYYVTIVRNMVGRVLRRHGVVRRDGRTYHLEGYGARSPAERDELADACREARDAYVARRGIRIWAHRTQAAGYVSGTLRYEVLKAAKFRCELGGVPGDERALEVNHIVPRARGGSDDPSNFQALCYSCNAMKRDRDDTDFRDVRAAYEHRESGCVFCDVPTDRVVAANPLAVVIRDQYPVTPGHLLVIPRRHTADYFDLGTAEVHAVNCLLHEARERTRAAHSEVTGFNVGINSGADAGQTVFHCHVHLIPRRRGDVADPRGGVRHTVSGKAAY